MRARVWYNETTFTSGLGTSGGCSTNGMITRSWTRYPTSHWSLVLRMNEEFVVVSLYFLSFSLPETIQAELHAEPKWVRGKYTTSTCTTVECITLCLPLYYKGKKNWQDHNRPGYHLWLQTTGWMILSTATSSWSVGYRDKELRISPFLKATLESVPTYPRPWRGQNLSFLVTNWPTH